MNAHSLGGGRACSSLGAGPRCLLRLLSSITGGSHCQGPPEPLGGDLLGGLAEGQVPGLFGKRVGGREGPGEEVGSGGPVRSGWETPRIGGGKETSGCLVRRKVRPEGPQETEPIPDLPGSARTARGRDGHQVASSPGPGTDFLGAMTKNREETRPRWSPVSTLLFSQRRSRGSEGTPAICTLSLWPAG